MKIRLGIGVENIHAQSGIVYDTDYQAILSNGTTRGVTLPNEAEQLIQNQLILNLKSAGIWSKLDAFYVFANNITDSTGGFARINWKNPSANYGTVQGSSLPSITPKSGFTGNGSNQGINLNLQHIPVGGNFNSTGASMGCFVGTIPGVSSAVLSTQNSNSRIRNVGGSSQIAGSSIVSTYTANSFVHINRTETAGPVRTIASFVNGTSSGTTPNPAAWVTTDTTNWYVLWNGASYGTTQMKMVFIGGDFTNEASSFNTIIQNHITSVNAL
jgi:hypothetical protein